MADLDFEEYKKQFGEQKSFEPTIENLIGQALMTALPGVVGGLIGGKEGAGIGVEKGVQAGTSYLDQEKSLAEKDNSIKKEFGKYSLGRKEKKEDTEAELQNKIVAAREQAALDLENKTKLAKLEGSIKGSQLAQQGQVDLQKALASREEKAPTEGQAASSAFAKRMERSIPIIENLSSYEASPEGKIAGFLPEFMKPEDKKLIDQAKRDFINATLRKESGAAISPTEFQSAELQYFPQINDPKSVLEQKALNRQIVFETLKSQGGKFYERMPSAGQIASNVPGQKISIIEPNEAIAGPSKPDFGKMSDEDIKKYLGVGK